MTYVPKSKRDTIVEKEQPRYLSRPCTIPDSEWIVETVKDNSFVFVGEVKVKGQEVCDEMDRHRSIKGYEPKDVAEGKARKKFPKTNPIIVTNKKYWKGNR